MEKQYLTEMTLSTSFFAKWKVLTPSERSMRSENRQKIDNMFSYELKKPYELPTEECARDGSVRHVWNQNQNFTSIEFLIGVAVHVFDWTVSFQRL